MTHIKKTIAITGGIATGKSTVTNILKEKNYQVIDADGIAKTLMEKAGLSYKSVVEFFGQSILKTDGQIDRKILGRKVFNDSQLLNKLNDLTHPHIFREIKRRIKDSCQNIIFLDIPLLFEVQEDIIKNGIEIDEIWLVYADRDTQVARLISRDGFTKEEAIKRIDSQISIDLKKKWADKVIYNLDTIERLKDKIDLLLKDLS